MITGADRGSEERGWGSWAKSATGMDYTVYLRTSVLHIYCSDKIIFFKFINKTVSSLL